MKANAQDRVRELLVFATSGIRNEQLAGAVFAVALIISDHIFNILGGFK